MLSFAISRLAVNGMRRAVLSQCLQAHGRVVQLP